METWEAALAGYRRWLVASGSARGTIRLRIHYLTALARQHAESDPWTLSLDDLLEFLANERWSPETRKSARASLRSLYAWALATDRVALDPTARLPRVRIPRREPRPAPAAVLTRALLTAGPREKLMLRLAAWEGLRRAEIAALHTNSIVDGALHIVGKGGRERLVPIAEHLQEELARVPAGWVFPNRSGGHLSADHVGRVISRLLGPGWTAHKLRHRFSSRAYEAERDLLTVQELLGHASPVTTRIYTAIPPGARIAAVRAAADVAA